MSPINPLLSRLFGKSPPPEEPERIERDIIPASAPEAPKPRPELQLPPEHPLNRLWRLYSQERSGASRPDLCLKEGEGLTEADMKGALFQLQVLVNTTAKRRLELAQPKPRDGETPPVPDLDAQAVVFVPRNGLSAWLLIYPPVGGGKELEREELVQALEREQVRFGVDQALLDALPQDPARYFHLFPVAWGALPKHGVDGQIVELFPRTVERKFAVDEHNRVDYTSLTFFNNVDEGSVICRIIPPTEGVPGRTVRDQEISARDGRAASVPKGRNTHLSEEGDALLASISGQVEFSGRSFQVKPLLEIPGDVDFSTGNINFVGDVHIKGDICAGFTVRAIGSVTVDGGVEACSVEAGGDLVVARGVQGDNQAVIRAHRNVYAKYLENCCVCAKESLHTDCVINCEVYCDGAVEARSGRMTIIGGTIWAGREVSAGTIGSRTECRTDIFLGGLPCGEFDYGLIEREAAELQEELDKTERQPDSPQKVGRLSKLRVKLLVAQKKLEELNKEKELMEAERNGNSDGCRMLCDTVYPGTCLTIDGTSYRFDHKLQPCAASLLDGEIHLI